MTRLGAVLKIKGSVLLAAIGLALPAQGLGYVTEHYARTEAMVPMRDGTRLFTVIYRPKEGGRNLPIMIERTPYSAAPEGTHEFRGDLGPSPLFGREGFIFVYQDVRGCMMSEGRFQDLTPALARHDRPSQVDESTDTFDTVEWLLQHVPGHNGRVGQWGISYPGFYAAEGLIGAHPAVKAVSPQAPIVDWFTGDDFHRNGALWLPHLFNFIANFGRVRGGPTSTWPAPFQHGTTDGYAFFQRLGPLANADAHYFKGRVPFWNEVMAHGSYDAFWRARDLRPHLRDIRPAVLTVGGWFDAENLYGALQLDRTLDRQSPATRHVLVMGPWSHGGWARGTGERLGDVVFQSPTSTFFQTQVEFPFFMNLLKDAPDPGLPRAWVFETGRNRWRRSATWPPVEAQPEEFYFQAQGRLGPARPEPAGSAAYLSDPERPVPFYNGVQIGMAQDYMTADQRFAGRRPDVLVFQTEVLAEDLTVAGPIQARLWVSTTGTDADWVVKVIDVYPDDPPAPGPGRRPGNPMAGYQQLLRGEVMRGKFRNSFEQPQPFTPGQPALVAFPLNDVCHTFLKGHRLLVQIQSSWFPLMDRNPQVFTDIYRARAEDFRPAEERLLFGADHPSCLILPVLK
jgi:hypothetical protein